MSWTHPLEGLEPRLLLDAATPTFDFSNGFDAGQFTLNGGASVTVDGDLRLTDATSGTQSRSAFYSTRVPIDQFVTRFVYDPNEVRWARSGGISLVLQNHAPTVISGNDTGGGPAGFRDIEPAVAMVLPLGGGFHLKADSLTAGLATVKSDAYRPEIGAWQQGHTYELTLSYDGSVLTMIARDRVTGDQQYQHYNIDIPALVGDTQAWVGFSATTGSKDERRNTHEIDAWTWYADAGQLPPTAQFTMDSLSPYQALEGNVIRAAAPYSVDFDAATSFDPDGSVAGYAWDLDGDGTTDATGAQVSHTYTTPGTYTATLVVTDDGGIESAPRQFTVVVSDALQAVIRTNRTEGAGPLAVHFDATETLGLADGDFLNARFVWDFDVTDTDPTGVYEHGEGFVASHVFERPGTYTVRLTVTDIDGHVSTQDTTITVTDIDGTWTSYYFSTDGDDANPGTIELPKQTLAHAASLAGPNVRLLLARGDFWTISSQLKFSADGPVVVDAYTDPAAPSDARPIVLAGWVDGAYRMIDMNGSDWRVLNLELRNSENSYSSPRTPGGIQLNGTNNLVAHTRFQDMGGYAAPMGGDGNVLFANTARNAGPYFVYGSPVHGGIIGNDVEIESEHREHVIRFQGGFQTYIAHNVLGAKETKSNVQMRGQTGQIVIYANEFLGRGSGPHPQNDDNEEYVHHTVWDANTFRLNPDYPPAGFALGGTAIGIEARHTVIRNNVSINYDRLFGIGSHVWIGRSVNVHVYNNTVFSDASMGKNSGLLGTVGHADGVVIRNNLVYSEIATSPDPWVNVMEISSSATDVTCGHNFYYGASWNPDADLFEVDSAHYMTFAQWQAAGFGTGTIVGTQPRFVSTEPASADFLRLAADSPAIDAGAPVPIFSDRAGAARPMGAGYDMGAYEHQPAHLPGDANGDGRVDDRDLNVVLGHWGETGGWAEGDFDASTTVDDRDLSILLSHWGDGQFAQDEPVLTASAVTPAPAPAQPTPATVDLLTPMAATPDLAAPALRPLRLHHRLAVQPRPQDRPSDTPAAVQARLRRRTDLAQRFGTPLTVDLLALP